MQEKKNIKSKEMRIKQWKGEERVWKNMRNQEDEKKGQNPPVDLTHSPLGEHQIYFKTRKIRKRTKRNESKETAGEKIRWTK